ncbi:MAG: DUF2267 domain-containing protein [Isosphaeraceae bacterium]|nr:DUF2267 domain-containing protein [Isosphaeraceae bacterium]
MSTTTHAPFESTYQTTNLWLKQLMAELGWDDAHRAYHALRAVLHALRDRLTVEEAVDLGAQLPMLVRGFYYEGWVPAGKPLKERKKEDFLAHIAAEFRHDPEVFPEAVAWAVFKVLESRVSAGEIRDVAHVLPSDIRTLWPRTEATHV